MFGMASWSEALNLCRLSHPFHSELTFLTVLKRRLCGWHVVDFCSPPNDLLLGVSEFESGDFRSPR